MLGGQTAAQIIANTLGQVPEGISVIVTAGTIGNGGTIPLPSGYTRAQCKYAVWAYSVRSSAGHGGSIHVEVNQSNGVVSVYGSFYDSESDFETSGTAGYLCIAVK